MVKKGNNILLSVIIPAFRQEETIDKDIKSIKNILEKIRFDFEIIIVVDGLVDKTYQKAKKLKDPKIKIYAFDKNQGKGFAVRFGMKKAKGGYIAFLDAGMEIDPNGLSLLLEHMAWYNSDVIVGSIRHSASKVLGYPPQRKIASLGYHLLTRILFGLNITDSQRGIKIFKRQVLEKVLPRLLVKRHAFDIEMLAVANRLGFSKIHDGPVKMDCRKIHYSSIGPDTAWNMLLDTLAVFYRLKILRYYDKGHPRKSRYDKNLGLKINVG